MNEKNNVMFLLDESPKNDPPENITLPTYSIYHFNNPHTNAEWYQNDDPFVKYHIMGHAPIDAQGPGAESLNEATKNYQHFGKKFMRRGLSDRQIARLDNKHNIDQSIFDLAQEDLEIRYNYDKQRYENGEISEQKWRQLENRYNRWSRNLGNNQLSLDQKQNPLNYVQVHKPGDIAPALFSIGLPLTMIGGINSAVFLAPYAWSILSNPVVQAIGTYYGIKNFFSKNGISKTINHIRNGEYWQAGLSGLGDIIDISPVGIAAGSAIRGAKNFGKGLNTWDWFKQTFNHADTVKAINWIQGAMTGKVKTSGVLPSDAVKMFKTNPWLDVVEDASGRTHKARFGNVYDHNDKIVFDVDMSIFNPIRQRRHYSINDFDDINYAMQSDSKNIDTSKLTELLNNATKEQIISLGTGWGNGELSLIPLWKNHLLYTNNDVPSINAILENLEGLPDSRFIIESSKLLPDFANIKPFSLTNTVLGTYKNNKKYITHSVTSDNFKQILENFNGVTPMPSLGVFPTDVVNRFNQYHNNGILIFGNPTMLKASKLYPGDGWTTTIHTAYDRNANMSDVDDVFNKMRKGYSDRLKPVSLEKFLTTPFQSVVGIKNPTNTILKWADKNLKQGDYLHDYFEAKYMGKWPLDTSEGMIIPSHETGIVDWATQKGIPYRLYDASDPKTYDEAVRKFLEEHPELVFTDKIE